MEIQRRLKQTPNTAVNKEVDDIRCNMKRSVLWGPMAVAIAGELFIAALRTLLVLPTMYAAWYKVKPGTEIEDVSISG